MDRSIRCMPACKNMEKTGHHAQSAEAIRCSIQDKGGAGNCFMPGIAGKLEEIKPSGENYLEMDVKSY